MVALKGTGEEEEDSYMSIAEREPGERGGEREGGAGDEVWTSAGDVVDCWDRCVSWFEVRFEVRSEVGSSVRIVALHLTQNGRDSDKGAPAGPNSFLDGFRETKGVAQSGHGGRSRRVPPFRRVSASTLSIVRVRCGGLPRREG